METSVSDGDSSAMPWLSECLIKRIFVPRLCGSWAGVPSEAPPQTIEVRGSAGVRARGGSSWQP